jgi:nucleosome binding factor SPN SPT16 subunit
MATPKKCSYFEKDLVGKHPTINVHVLKRGKEDALNREIFNSLVNIIRKGGNKKLGSIFKGEYLGAFVPSWLECVEQNQLEKVEISNCLGLFLAVKDASELVSNLT